MTTAQDAFLNLYPDLVAACRDVYGEGLVSVIVYGSAGRGTQRRDSDLDVLIVAEGLPNGRRRRVARFRPVEDMLDAALRQLHAEGITILLSPVFRTPDEVRQGSPLFLDMVDDALYLYDRGRFFEKEMAAFRERLAALGARRVWLGSTWYWDLKPDYKPGEVFEL